MEPPHIGDYCTVSSCSTDVETQDIYVRRDDVAGPTRECVSVICTTAGESSGGRTRTSRAKLAQYLVQYWRCGPGSLQYRRHDGSDDVLLDRPLTEDDFVKYAGLFEDDLAGFIHHGSHLQLSVEYKLFPNIKRTWTKDRSTSYTVCE